MSVKKIKATAVPLPFVKDLDTPLLRLSPLDVYTLRHAVAGVHAFGQIGAGKTTGGKMLACAYLRAGFGGLSTSVKPADVPLWQRYLAEHGRSNSLILFDENEGFNFLDYELARHGMNGIGAVVECLMRVIEAAKRANPTASQRGGEPFWEDETRKCLRRSIMPLYAANGSVSIPDIVKFLTSAPTSLQDVTSRAWRETSFLFDVMQRAKESPKVPVSAAEIDDTIFFWRAEWLAVPERTRGNVVVSVTSVLDRFRYGRLQRTFCGRTTIVPEMTFHGAVILPAMSTLTGNDDAVIGQMILKFFFMRAVLSRNSLEEKHRERPVFLWCDEAQETVHSYDAEFLSMCRDSKCCVTYLTQSLPNYYSKMGGDNPRDAALSLAGKFGTHLFFSNICPETNEYAARICGKVVKLRRNSSSGTSTNTTVGITQGSSVNSGSSSTHGHAFGVTSGGPGNSTSNSGTSHTSGTAQNFGSSRGRSTGETSSEGCTETIEYSIEPGDFGRILKTGGPANQNQVTAVLYQAGRIFKASGTNMLLEVFNQ